MTSPSLLDPPPEEPRPDATTLPAPAGWPAPPAATVYHQLLGEIVTRIAPQTEADPVAILTQLLVAFGAAIGRGAWFTVEATPPSPARVHAPRRRQQQGPQGLILGSRPPADRHRRRDP